VDKDSAATDPAGAHTDIPAPLKDPIVTAEKKLQHEGSWGKKVAVGVLFALGFVIVVLITLRYQKKQAKYRRACEASRQATSDLAMLTPSDVARATGGVGASSMPMMGGNSQGYGQMSARSESRDTLL
jgi:hypothetical protein